MHQLFLRAARSRRNTSQLRHYGSMERLALTHMVNQFRQWGHLQADINPLRTTDSPDHPMLEKPNFQSLFTSETVGDISGLVYLKPKNSSHPQAEEIYDHLQQAYCSKIGAEFQYLVDPAERNWLAQQLEERHDTPLSPSEMKNACTKMLMAESFEHFLAKKFASFKRYSGEGSESMLPCLETILSSAANSGNVEHVVIGMPHRGRLASMVSLFDYPMHKLFWKIQGNTEFPPDIHGVDDVTSHIGVSVHKTYSNAENRPINVSLVHNPSHLEIINPVVTGKVRSKQDAGVKALGVLLHGDAAFSGQGCVPEGLSLSGLPDYSTRGTIHLIVNNQIGFTTTYEHGRSSTYCSDIAKGFDAPILHVHGEDMTSVIQAAKIAVNYRNTFHKDIVIDLVGYRRHGHNEVDEPGFTQPGMYTNIRSRVSFPQAYAQVLVKDQVTSDAKLASVQRTLEQHLDAEFQRVEGYAPSEVDAFEGKWKTMQQPRAHSASTTNPETGICESRLRAIGSQSVNIPDHVNIHDRLRRTHVEARNTLIQKGKLDWATAEAMAFGSLLQDGHHVRLAGQDCKRGTFSQRHAVLIDQDTEEPYVPLHHLEGTDGSRFSVVNSNLSELAVMAFEYGYSWDDPKNLTIWEAQFGDFCNGAQIVIDQFIASGESKWMRQSGIVLLLPHGYDGAGPDHSSGKLERFLQLCDSSALVPSTAAASVNLQVMNLTTPANYFHALRRQQHRNYRKPLIIMAPKTLLRSTEAQSELSGCGPQTSFQPILKDASVSIQTCRRMIFCSGKIYYDLMKKRHESHHQDDTVIVRIEELSPFPFHEIQEEVDLWPNVQEYVWVQEEPSNQGGWMYIQPHLNKCLRSSSLRYVGREALAASAVGLLKEHQEQLETILESAFPRVS